MIAKEKTAGVLTAVGGDEVPAAKPRSTVVTFLLIFAAALMVRALFFTVQVMHSPQLWSATSPYWNDELSNIALNLAQGRGYSSPFSAGSMPTSWLCPLIPLLWAGVIRLVGSASGHTVMILIYISALPSAACAPVYWLIARHVLRSRPGGERAALAVAAVFIVWPESLFILDFPWYFPWQELATAVMVQLGMRWLDRPVLRTAIPLGLSAGILGLINVTPVPVFAVLLVLPLFRRDVERSRALGAATIGGLVAVLMISPWLVRNAVVLHAFVPMRSDGGAALWEGNNPVGCIRETKESVEPHNGVEELRRYERLGDVEYSRHSFHKAVEYIHAHPRITLVRIAERAYVIWFTDATDHWSWDSVKYWQKGRAGIDNAMASTLAAWGLVILMAWALATRRLSELPYKGVFIALIIVLPFPYYFTMTDNDYVAILRSWLLLLAVLALSGKLRKPGINQS